MISFTVKRYVRLRAYHDR